MSSQITDCSFAYLFVIEASGQIVRNCLINYVREHYIFYKLQFLYMSQKMQKMSML